MVDISLVKNGNQSAGGPVEDPLVRAVIEVGAVVAAESDPLVFNESNLRQAIIERSQVLCHTNPTRLCRLFDDRVVSITIQFTKEDARRVAEVISKEWKTPSQPQPVTSKFIEMLSNPENFRRTGPILDAIASGKNGIKIIAGLISSFPRTARALALCSMEDSARAAQVIGKLITLSPDKETAQNDWVRVLNILGGAVPAMDQILPLPSDDERSPRLARLQMFSAAAETLREKGFDVSHELLEICARYDAEKATPTRQKKLQRELARLSDNRTNGQLLFDVEYNSKEDDPKRIGKIKWLDVVAREKDSAVAVSDYDPEFEEWLRTEHRYKTYDHISKEALRACYQDANRPDPDYGDVVTCAVNKIATSCFQSALTSRNLEEMPLDGMAPFDVFDDVVKCYERNSGLEVNHRIFDIGPGKSLTINDLRGLDDEPEINLSRRPDGVRISFYNNVCATVTFPTADFIVCTPNGICTDGLQRKFAFFASSVEDAIERGRAYYCNLDSSSDLCKLTKSE